MKKAKIVVFLILSLILCLNWSAPAFAAHSDFSVEDGVLIEYTGPGGNVTLPEGVTEIGASVFIECGEDLTGVVMGSGLKTIGENAFRFCTGLTSVTIPDGVVTIGDFAFHGCDNLKTVVIPGSVTDIAWSTFSTHADSAEYVVIPGLTIYGERGSYAETYAQEYDIPFSAIGIDIPAPSFADVKANDYFANPVRWAVEKGITSGTSATTFSPNANCTVAQILTFLWRANGSQRPAGSNPFSDVKNGAYYADAATWAYEKGLVSSNTFGGDIPCTRSMAVTYMWKAAGSPSAKSANFTDVSDEAEYASAVAWAVEKGVTSGTSATTFSPGNVCTRGQIVTFLYRHMA